MDVFEDEVIQAEMERHLAAQEATNALLDVDATVDSIVNTPNSLPSGDASVVDDGVLLSPEAVVGVVVVFLALAALTAVASRGSKVQRVNTLVAAQAPWTSEHVDGLTEVLHSASMSKLPEAACDQLIRGLQLSASETSAPLHTAVSELEVRVAAIVEGSTARAVETLAAMPLLDLPTMVDAANVRLQHLQKCIVAATSTPAATRPGWSSLVSSVNGGTSPSLAATTKRAAAVLERLRDTGEQLLKDVDKNKKGVYARMDSVRAVLMLMHTCGFPGSQGVQAAMSGRVGQQPKHRRGKSSWTGRQSLSARMSRARASSRLSMDTPRLASARGSSSAAVPEPSGVAQLLSAELACLEQLADVGEALFDAHTVAKEVFDKAMGREPAARTEAIMGRRSGLVLLSANEESDVRKVGRAGEGTASVNKLTALMQYREGHLAPIVEMEHVSVEEVMHQSQVAAERAAPALVQALQRASEDLEEAVQRYEDKVKAAGRHYVGVLTDVATGRSERTLSGERELRSAVELLPKLDHMLRESSTLTLLLTQRAKEQALTSLQQASASQARNTTGDVTRVAIPLGLQDVGLLLAQANKARHAEEQQGESSSDDREEDSDMDLEGTPSEEDESMPAANPSSRAAAALSSRSSRSLITTGTSSALGSPTSHQEQLLGMYFSGYAVVQAQAVAAMQEQGLRQQISIVQQERHHLALMLENRNNAKVMVDAFRQGLETLALAMTAQQEKQSEAIKEAATATTRALYHAEASRAAAESRKDDLHVLQEWKRACLKMVRGMALLLLCVATAVVLLDQLLRIGPAVYKKSESVRWIVDMLWRLLPLCDPFTGDDGGTSSDHDTTSSSTSLWRWAAAKATSVASYFSGSTRCFLHWMLFGIGGAAGGFSILQLFLLLLTSVSGTAGLGVSVIAFAWNFRVELADLLPAAGLTLAILAVLWLVLCYVVLERVFLPVVPPLSTYEEAELDRIIARVHKGERRDQGARSAKRAMQWPFGVAQQAHSNVLLRQALVSVCLAASVVAGSACGVWVSRSVPRQVPEVLYPPVLYGACDTAEAKEQGSAILYHGVTSLRWPGLVLTSRLTQCAVWTMGSRMTSLLTWVGGHMWQAATKST